MNPFLLIIIKVLFVSLAACVMAHIVVVFHLLTHAKNFLLYLKKYYPQKWHQLGAPRISILKFLNKRPFWPEIFHSIKRIDDLTLKVLHKTLVKKIAWVQVFPTLIGVLFVMTIVPVGGFYLYLGLIRVLVGLVI